MFFPRKVCLRTPISILSTTSDRPICPFPSHLHFSTLTLFTHTFPSLATTRNLSTRRISRGSIPSLRMEAIIRSPTIQTSSLHQKPTLLDSSRLSVDNRRRPTGLRFPSPIISSLPPSASIKLPRIDPSMYIFVRLPSSLSSLSRSTLDREFPCFRCRDLSTFCTSPSCYLTT